MERKIIKCICMAILATFCFSGVSIAEIPKIGMVNWNTWPIESTHPSALVTFSSFCKSTKTPSINNSWIIQEAADSVQMSFYNSGLDAFVLKMDQDGHHLSLNYADDNWTNQTGHNAESVGSNVTNLLNYISNIPAATVSQLVTNVDGKQPTLDINLDVEPKFSPPIPDPTTPIEWQQLYDQWLSMMQHVHSLIYDFNNPADGTTPPIKVTLSAFIPMVMVDPVNHMTTSQFTEAWTYCDTLIVMGYRNLPCFTIQCEGTDPSATGGCEDGFTRIGRALVATVPPGKYCSIALELSRGNASNELSGCDKISFGYSKIYDVPTDPVGHRTNFLKTAIEQGWGGFTAAEQAMFNPNGAFILHSYEPFSCFRDDIQAPGSPDTCDTTCTSCTESGCTPTLYAPPSGVYGDVNSDGIVDANDLLALEELLGSCRGDLNLDGIVNVHDILITIGNWGTCE
jgi:hypothetical protein